MDEKPGRASRQLSLRLSYRGRVGARFRARLARRLRRRAARASALAPGGFAAGPFHFTVSSTESCYLTLIDFLLLDLTVLACFFAYFLSGVVK
ncbi:MAG: hypothetical protein ACI4GB_08200 [Acutalibacteraceae bacterium]